jgi:prepilin-type N-terminal cleavage/methylation domain-containing protein
MRDENGFTLIELLVVILTIAVLATIALPAFLEHQQRGQDANAKSDARNLYSEVAGCYAAAESFLLCDSAAELGPIDLPLGSGPGQVEVMAAGTTSDTVEIRAISRATSGGANHEFVIKSDADGSVSRECSPAGRGGCTSGAW